MNNNQEIWKWCAGFEQLYSVSNFGRVCSFCLQGSHVRGCKRRHEHRYIQKTIISNKPVRILKPCFHSFGYPKVHLSRNGNVYEKNVHILVLEAFAGPCPPGMECCHNDGNPKNCKLDNLRWDTHQNNLKEMVKHKQGNYIPPLPKYWKDYIKVLEQQIKELEFQLKKFSIVT